jgi:hypothetical protein
VNKGQRKRKNKPFRVPSTLYNDKTLQLIHLVCNALRDVQMSRQDIIDGLFYAESIIKGETQNHV